jgi:hypothetical protein
MNATLACVSTDDDLRFQLIGPIAGVTDEQVSRLEERMGARIALVP